MTEHFAALTTLTRDLVAIDSRSFVSNVPIAERIAAEVLKMPGIGCEVRDFRVYYPTRVLHQPSEAVTPRLRG